MDSKLPIDSRVCWEIKNELVQKRKQIGDLKKELQEANLKMFQLQTKLDSQRGRLKEFDFEKKLTNSNKNSLEAQVLKLKNDCEQLKLKEEMRSREIHSAKCQLERMTQANNQLTDDNAELKDKIVFYDYLQSEMDGHKKEMDATVEAIKINIEKLAEHHELIKICSTSINYAEEFRKTNEFLITKNEQLRKENMECERKLLALSDDCNHILDLERAASEKTQLKSRAVDYEVKIERLQKEGDGMRLLLIVLERTLTAESEMNAELDNVNRDYADKVEELEEAIGWLEKE